MSSARADIHLTPSQLRELRLELRLSMREVARRAGMNHNAVSRLEATEAISRQVQDVLVAELERQEAGV